MIAASPAGVREAVLVVAGPRTARQPLALDTVVHPTAIVNADTTRLSAKTTAG